MEVNCMSYLHNCLHLLCLQERICANHFTLEASQSAQPPGFEGFLDNISWIVAMSAAFNLGFNCVGELQYPDSFPQAK